MPANLNSFISVDDGIQEITASEIVFPDNGGFVIGENMKIQMEEVNTNDKTCEIKVQQPKVESWFATKNWKTLFGPGDIEFNRATPDSEKVPCQKDSVVFPKSNYHVDMQFAKTIKVANLQVEEMPSEHTAHFFETELGQSRFLNSETTMIEIDPCDRNSKCICELDELTCLNEVCEAPKCMSPIKPKGFCCQICGSVIEIPTKNLRDTPKTIMMTIKGLIEKSGQFELNSIEFYATYSDEKTIQLVIVDAAEEYDEVSVKVGKFINDKINALLKPELPVTMQNSGLPYNPNVTNNLAIVVILPLFIVLLAFGVIYFINYDETMVPRVLAMIRVRQYNPTAFIFARFDNTQNDDEVTATIETRKRGENPECEQQLILQQQQQQQVAFDNPMFDAQLRLKETTSSAAESLQHKQEETMEDIKLDEVEQVQATE